MRTTTHVVQYVLAGLLVVILGSLAGWYVFIREQVSATQATDSARGLDIAPSFGSAGIYPGTGNTQGAASSSTIATGSTGSSAPRLWQITASPVAGMGFASSSPVLYFAERATGNILEADPSATRISRLTNTLFPRIYEALFAENAVVLRSVSDSGVVTSYAARIATSTEGAPAALQGVYLPQNIPTIAVKKAPLSIFYTVKGAQGGVQGVTTDWKGGAQKKVFASALSQWRAHWLSDGKIYLVQNPSDDVTGYAFQLQPSGALSPLIGNLPGLTILPHPSGALLYGTSAGGNLDLFVRASANASPVRLTIRTTAEKCVWSPWKALIAYCAAPQAIPSKAFLRNWYSGSAHTSDVWWKVDVSAGTTEVLYRPDASAELDVENPVIDGNGGYIAFQNGLDKSLWMLKIDQ